MSFDARKKKSWSNKSGVSEIIGNILILMITVVLFSSIMAFVQNMPMPEQLTKATFSAGITFYANGTKANLTITHAGGDMMKTAQTMILVEQDSFAKGYNLTNDLSLNNALVWKTGMTWSKQLSGTSYTSVIIVTVVDMAKHASVWTSQITGGTGQNPPVIGQRYTDSDISTPSKDPVLEWENFSFFVTITDPDNDLNPSKIWIDTTQLEGTGFSKRLPQTNLSGGKVFQWDFLGIQTRGLSALKLDGAIILIHAEDRNGHASNSTFVMSITKLPVNNVPIPPPEENNTDQGDAGFPGYMDNRFDNFGWVILGEAMSKGVRTGQANISDKTTQFAKDARVFIRVASTTGSTSTLNNLMGGNVLTIQDSRTGMAYTPNYTGSSNTNPPTPFYSIPYSGNAYLYESQFNTTGLPPGSYTLTMILKNVPGVGKPQTTFAQPATITITQAGNPIQFIPQIKMSMFSDYSGYWGNKSAIPFQVSSSNMYKVYVSIYVVDATTPLSVSCSDVRIVDMTGSAELFGTPPSGQMISSFARLDQHNYSFSIDLRMNNGVLWRSGTSSYTLVIKQLNDANEGMYSLATQVYVTGAGSRADFFSGTSGMGTGNGNFNTRGYVYYTQNSNLFTTQTLMQSSNTPSSASDYVVTAMAVGDVSGDGHKDILVAQGTSNQLYLITNTLNTYGTWQSASAVSRPDGYTNPIQGIAFGDVNGDGQQDFAYFSDATPKTGGHINEPTSPGTIVIYNTTYGSKGWVYNPPTAIRWSASAVISKIDLRDMTGDGRADLIVLVGGIVYVYDLKYDYDPVLKTQESNAKFSKSTGTSTVDFSIADVNNDGYLDIVTADTVQTAYPSGGTGVNFDKYTLGSGTKTSPDSGYNSVGYKVISGMWVSGTLATMETAGLEFRENGTTIGPQTAPYFNSVKVLMRTQTLANTPDQVLNVTAMIGDTGGNPAPGEVFYVWYSVDGSVYTPVITVSSTVLKSYTYALPSTVMNKQIYIMITDSLSSESDVLTTYIVIKQLAVYTGLFAGYTGQLVVGDTSFICARAAAIDGPQTTSAPYLEVVAAKNGRWDVYKYAAGAWNVMTGQPSTNTSMFVTASSKVSAMIGLAPTLFRAVDINGDGYTDILVSNYTTTDGSDNSFIGFYMNLYTGSSTQWRYYSVTSWIMVPPGGNAVDPWLDVVVAASLDGA